MNIIYYFLNVLILLSKWFIILLIWLIILLSKWFDLSKMKARIIFNGIWVAFWEVEALITWNSWKLSFLHASYDINNMLVLSYILDFSCTYNCVFQNDLWFASFSDCCKTTYSPIYHRRIWNRCPYCKTLRINISRVSNLFLIIYISGMSVFIILLHFIWFLYISIIQILLKSMIVSITSSFSKINNQNF